MVGALYDTEKHVLECGRATPSWLPHRPPLSGFFLFGRTAPFTHSGQCQVSVLTWWPGGSRAPYLCLSWAFCGILSEAGGGPQCVLIFLN